MSKCIGVKKLGSVIIVRFSIGLSVLLCFANHVFSLRFQRSDSMPTFAWVVTPVYTVSKIGPNKYEP